MLTLMLTLSCMMLPAAAEGTDYTGEWYLVQLVQEGTSFSPTDLDMSMTMTLMEDGTGKAVTVQGGDESSFDITWELTEGGITVTQDGVSNLFADSDGMLVSEIGGTMMTFSREALAPVVVPVVVVAESLDAFQGTWKLSRLNMDDSLLAPSVLASAGMVFDASLTVEGDKASLGLTVLGIELFGGSGVPLEAPVVFENGTLVLKIPGSEETSYVFQMTDTGELLPETLIPTFELVIPLYLARVEETTAE